MFTHLKRFLKIFNLYSILALLAALLGGAVTYTPARAAGEVYVAPLPGGLTTGLCNSWANACDLKYALSEATFGSALWVKKGTYRPTSSTDRTVSFTLKNGVEVYGGFAGTETQLSERNTAENVTILSGDLNSDDIGFAHNGENSYHVVVGSNTNSTAILNGFTVGGGNANGSSSDSRGGGMFITNGSPTLTNVIFFKNSANSNGGGLYNLSNSNPTLTNVTFSQNRAFLGGGMYNQKSNPMLTKVTFSGNSASKVGGGMYNLSSNPTLTTVTFSGNSALHGGGLFNAGNSNPTVTNATFSSNAASSGNGGGVNNVDSSPKLTNVTLSGNSATGNGGGMYTTNGSPPLKNVTFSGNSASSGGGMYYNSSNVNLVNVIIANSMGGGDCVNSAGVGRSSFNNLIESTSASACGLTNGVNGDILGVDPKLAALANNGGFTETMALQNGSPAIDSGNDENCPATDQRGATRPQREHCDIGAYERPYVTGDLDTTFSRDGLVTTNVVPVVPPNPSLSDQIWGMVIQSNSKIVAAGFSFIPSTTTSDFALARYNANGTLDTTFSGDGMLITDFGGTDEAWDVAVQSDGKIIASGRKCISGSCDVALARYTSNGTLDITFSGDGKQITDFGGGDNGSYGGLAIQPDGKILLAGYASNGADREFAVYRYNTNGTLDITFSGDGIAVGNFGVGKQDYTYDLAIQGDGKIVVVGQTGDDADHDNFAIARLNPNGTADTTFSGDGRVITDLGADDGATALALQPDGKIVVAGQKCSASTCSFALARYTTNGSLDTTFNITGRKVFTFVPNLSSYAYDVLITSNGRIVVAGYANAAGNQDFAVARLLPSGAFDTSFSGDGKVMVDFGGGADENAFALALQPLDGKYVVGGSTNVTGGIDFGLARVLP